MTDERLKIWIDFGKWAVVSVGLVIMTKVIDTGFKDREVGINEIKEYDKYVSLVTDNNKISERRLLAQYFSLVTPSEKLKAGWSDYYNIVNEEFIALQHEKAELLEIRNSKDSIILSESEMKQIDHELQRIDEELTPTFNNKKKVIDQQAALDWEKIGFEALINKDLENAIVAFQNAEKAYPSFHQVYELARYLVQQKESHEVHDDTFWSNIYTTILADYSWRISKNTKSQLRKLTGTG